MAVKPIIDLQNISYTWPGEKNPTIELNNFSINQGEKVLIRGKSGSGKSTLLSLLSGIQIVDEGHLYIKGVDLKCLKAKERDHFRGDHIGYIFQQFNLLPYLSVEENILSPLMFSTVKRNKERGDHKQRVKHLLNSLALNVPLDKSVQNLSIGQQQRVAAARALIGEPEIIIADEPTSALDKETAEEFIGHLFTECERLNTTLIFVSHNDNLESIFPRVEFLEKILDRNSEGGMHV